MKLDCKMQMLLSIVYWRLPPGEQGGPAGGALGLDVVLLEDDALVGEVVEVRGDDGGVVPGHVIVAQVIGQDEHYVRRTSEKCQHNEKEGWKVSLIPVLSAFVFVAMALVSWNKDELILMMHSGHLYCLEFTRVSTLSVKNVSLREGQAKSKRHETTALFSRSYLSFYILEFENPKI